MHAPSERPVLVLLPGMDGTGELFAPLIEALGGTWDIRCVRYPVSTPLDYPALEAIAAQTLPASGPYLLLGESFSGPIAISLAARQPEGLRGLVLCATFARNPRPALSRFGGMVGLFPMGWLPVALLSAALLGRFATPELRALLRQSLSPLSSSVLRARLRAMMGVDATQALRTVRVPVLYLRAREDRLVPRHASEAMRADCPTMQFAELDAPHGLLQCAPWEAARRLQAFARAVGVAPQEAAP